MEKMERNTESSCSALDSVKSRLNRKSSRRVVGDFKECITCTLCSGYLRSALTITLCMHSFCRECLTRHIRMSKACPKCLRLIHPVKPSTNIRSDLVLQRLVYKMLPGLFEIELERRKKQVLSSSENNRDLAQGNSRRTRKFNKRSAIFTGYENVSICLQHRPRSTIQNDIETQRDLGPRYLLCPSRLTIEILKRFIGNKFSLSRTMEVKIFYMDHPLLDDYYKLSDVAYIYGWDQVNPMMLSYNILQLNPSASVLEQTSAVTTQHSTADESTAGTKPLQESSTTSASQSSQQPHPPVAAAVISASSPSPPGDTASTTMTTVSSSVVDAAGDIGDCSLDGANVDQCQSTSSEGRKRGRKRKKSRRSSSSPSSPTLKRFCVRDDGPGIVKTFLSVKDRHGRPRSLPESSTGTGSLLVGLNLQSSSVSCVQLSAPFFAGSGNETMDQDLSCVDNGAGMMTLTADQNSSVNTVNTCEVISAEFGQSLAAAKDAILDHQNSDVFQGTNEFVASDTLSDGISLAMDGVESALGLVNGTDFQGDVAGVKDVSPTKSDQTLERNDAETLASSSEREVTSGLNTISNIPDVHSRLPSLCSDSINTVSSTIETKTIVDSGKPNGSEIPHIVKTLPSTLSKDKTQFLEADSSMLPTTPCPSGISTQPNCSQLASGLICETVANDKFGQKDPVLCPQCGRKAGIVDGTSVTSTSSSIRCHNCLSFNTSITLVINHALQSRINPEERIEFLRTQGSCEEPKERTCNPEVPLLHVNDPKSLRVKERGETIPADLVPKLECLEDDHISKGQNYGIQNHWDTTTRSHSSLSSSSAPSSFPSVPTITGHHRQTPADPNDLSGLQTKTTCQSDHQPSNGSPPRAIHPSTTTTTAASSPPARGSAAGSSGDRCPASIGPPLTGNKCVGRKQKSLESIIRQLQPQQQMSPPATAAAGAGSLKLSPKATPSVNRRPVVHEETPIRLPPTDREPSAILDRLTFRPNLEGQGQQGRLWSTENQSILRRALTMTGRNHHGPTGRFQKPEERFHHSAAAAPSINQSPYNFTAPPIKKLKNMFDGLESSAYTSSATSNNPMTSRGENRRLPQFTPTTPAPTLTIRDTTRGSGFNCLPIIPEGTSFSFQDNHVTRRHPTVAVTSANGFDAPLELTTKESRDRKRRETARKSDGDVLRTSFPLFDNRR